MLNVLVACEFSGTVRDAFAARGHNAWSCDLLPTERPGKHITGDVRTVLASEPWDLMIAHPTGPDRWKLRSLTYPGIAAAMATQWGWARGMGR